MHFKWLDQILIHWKKLEMWLYPKAKQPNREYIWKNSENLASGQLFLPLKLKLMLQFLIAKHYSQMHLSIWELTIMINQCLWSENYFSLEKVAIPKDTIAKDTTAEAKK